jgi:hypothetical protein
MKKHFDKYKEYKNRIQKSKSRQPFSTEPAKRLRSPSKDVASEKLMDKLNPV